MVRVHPDPPGFKGGLAQLGEHLLCKQGVVGSIPSSSTNELTIDESALKKTNTISVVTIVSNS
jgi:hypothetical protein